MEGELTDFGFPKELVVVIAGYTDVQCPCLPGACVTRYHGKRRFEFVCEMCETGAARQIPQKHRTGMDEHVEVRGTHRRVHRIFQIPRQYCELYYYVFQGSDYKYKSGYLETPPCPLGDDSTLTCQACTFAQCTRTYTKITIVVPCHRYGVWTDYEHRYVETAHMHYCYSCDADLPCDQFTGTMRRKSGRKRRCKACT